MTRAQEILEKAAPGFEGTVIAMKKRHPEISNPWALSWHMKNKGYTSHKKKTGGPKDEAGKLDPYHPAVQMSTKIPPHLKKIPKKKNESRRAADLAYAMYDKGPLSKKKKKNESSDYEGAERFHIQLKLDLGNELWPYQEKLAKKWGLIKND